MSKKNFGAAAMDNNDGYNPLAHLALEHLRAAGVRDPENELLNIYANLLPRKEDYDAEVEQFRADFYSAIEVKEYLDYIEKRADGDAEIYAELYDQGLTSEGRKAVPGFAEVQATSRQPEYNPVSYEEFTQSPDLLPIHFHEEAYAKSFARADEVLTERMEKKRKFEFRSRRSKAG